jgi:anti-sigma regulatory factor (Ser/Thr protein kinase)
MMTREFPKRIDSLESIFEFVAEFAAANGIGGDTLNAMQFGVEEIFTNLVKYNGETANDVAIAMNIANGRMALSLLDQDVHSYDLTKTPPVDITQPLHERTPGGLGIHLVKQMMDDVQYEYGDRTAKITLIKDLEK